MSIETKFNNFYNLINHKSLPDRMFSVLYHSCRNKSDYYRYLGESNRGEWVTNLEELFKNQTPVDLSNDDIKKIDIKLIDYLSDEGGRRGFEGKAVVYPKLRNIQNSRFDHCWFLQTHKDRWGKDSGWDICVQKFTDDWYLVNFGDSKGRFDFWFICDEIEGVLKLIEDKVINA